MIETQNTINFTTIPLVSGIILLIFGTFIFIFALWRRNERRKVNGILQFSCSDRMVNTKGTEKLLRVLALVLLLSGFLLITFEAISHQAQVSNQITSS